MLVAELPCGEIVSTKPDGRMDAAAERATLMKQVEEHKSACDHCKAAPKAGVLVSRRG